MDTSTVHSKTAVWVSYAAFAAFGVFWGSWGAAIPRIREQSGLTDGQLGTALLFIGAGALPAMLLTGRLIDRLGARTVTASALTLLGAAGFLVAATANGMTSLSLGLLLVGASSGAADVAINAGAAEAEEAAGRPVITRAHGMFSALVVASSLLAGVLTGSGLTAAFVFGLVAAALAGIAGFVFSTQRQQRQAAARPAGDSAVVPENPAEPGRPGRAFVLPVVLVGLLGALALASENAHQSWTAVFFEDIFGAGAAVSATGPAMFAAVAAITRFSVGSLDARRARPTVIGGALAAAAGAGLLAVAPNIAVALLGLGLAAAGTAVLYPTLLGIVSRGTVDAVRGRATSLLATVSYLGFLLGPVYVGLFADGYGLRMAMVAVAALGLLLAAAAPAVLRRMRITADRPALQP